MHFYINKPDFLSQMMRSGKYVTNTLGQKYVIMPCYRICVDFEIRMRTPTKKSVIKCSVLMLDWQNVYLDRENISSHYLRPLHFFLGQENIRFLFTLEDLEKLIILGKQ